MGFDRYDALLGARHALDAQRPPPGSLPPGPGGAPLPPRPLSLESCVDDAVLRLVADIEEREEAKEMDLARVASETARAGNARRALLAADEDVRGAEARRIVGATTGGGEQQPIFKTSVLAENLPLLEKMRIALADAGGGGGGGGGAAAAAGGVGRGRAAVVALLRLEKDAVKWYGANCRAYFRDVAAPRLLGSTEGATGPDSWPPSQSAAAPHSFVDLVLAESVLLQTALFSLTSQSGAVPAAFLEATGRCREVQRAAATTSDGGAKRGDEDVVVLVGVEGGEKGKKQKKAEMLVIDIE